MRLANWNSSLPALAALSARVGTHLDGDVVAALASALERHTWIGVELGTLGVAEESIIDHDHPEVSDLMAAAISGAGPVR